MGTTLFEMLQELSEKLPGCLHTSVVDQETGLALASVSESDPIDAAGADAYHSDLYRLTSLALEGMPMSQDVEGIVLSSEVGTFVSVPVEDTGYLWLVVTRRDTTVGFTQAIMRKNLAGLGESLRGLVH